MKKRVPDLHVMMLDKDYDEHSEIGVE